MTHFSFPLHLSSESNCRNQLTLRGLSSLGVTMASGYCSLLSWHANIWLASVYPIPRTKFLTLNKCRRVSAQQLNANLKLSSRAPTKAFGGSLPPDCWVNLCVSVTYTARRWCCGFLSALPHESSQNGNNAPVISTSPMSYPLLSVHTGYSGF